MNHHLHTALAQARAAELHEAAATDRRSRTRRLQRGRVAEVAEVAVDCKVFATRLQRLSRNLAAMVNVELPQQQSGHAHGEVGQLVRAAARGDQRAWEALVERYAGLLWATARAHRLNAADAADVVQTTWLRLVEHLPRLTTPASVGAWLATTARRECLRRLRESARCQPHDEMFEWIAADDRDVDADLLSAERDAALWHSFAGLPACDQALLRLLTADPVPSYQEISAALGMPIGSIGPTRARALVRLRHAMERTGLDEPAL